MCRRSSLTRCTRVLLIVAAALLLAPADGTRRRPSRMAAHEVPGPTPSSQRGPHGRYCGGVTMPLVKTPLVDVTVVVDQISRSFGFSATGMHTIKPCSGSGYHFDKLHQTATLPERQMMPCLKQALEMAQGAVPSLAYDSAKNEITVSVEGVPVLGTVTVPMHKCGDSEGQKFGAGSRESVRRRARPKPHHRHSDVEL